MWCVLAAIGDRSSSETAEFEEKLERPGGEERLASEGNGRKGAGVLSSTVKASNGGGIMTN